MNARFGIHRLAVVLLTASVASGTAAQEQGPQTEFPSSRVPGWSFTPAVAIGVIYDTNVALRDRLVSTGETEGDAVYNVIPAGQLQFVGRRTDFSAGYRGFLRRYVDATGLDRFEQRGTVGLKHTLSRRLSFVVRDSYAESPTTDEVELNGAPFRRTGSRRNTLGASSEFRITKFTTLSSRYDVTWIEFDRPDLFLTGGTMHALRNELSHRVNERVSLGGEYTYSAAFLDVDAREFGFQNAGAVLSVALGPHTTASASGGFAVLQDKSLDVTRSGPYVRLGLAHVLEHLTVGVGFERHYAPSFGFGGATSNQEVRGYVLMPLARNRVYTQASGIWRRSVPYAEDALQLDTIVLQSTIGFAATRWARVEGVYAYARQDSIVTGGEVDRHRLGVQFVISQPLRIR